ncbi:UNVERIFIED_CONTAM: hypothetical protein RMT77_016880 [Armadillidium vulgare]
MHMFGSVCYAYSQEKKKLDAHSKQRIFVGYDNESPAYLVYFPEQNNIKKVRCVKFTEKFGQEEETHEFEYEYTRPRTQEYETIEENEKEEPNKEELGENEKYENRYPKRQRNKPKYLEDYDDDSMDQNLLNVNYSMDYCYRMISVPKSYEEAMASSDSHHWKKAIDEEIDALVENDTYEPTPLPEGRSVVGGRWVFAIKQGPNDEEEIKVRCVTKGYSHGKDLDYQETFLIWMLMQVSVQEIFVHQMDVETFLNAGHYKVM